MPPYFSAQSSAMTHVRVDGVSKSFGDRRVLTDISFTVPGGTRLGLIGENGSGKSTLLRIIAGLLEADAGTVTAVAPGGVRPTIGLLHQQAPFDARDTVDQALEAAVADVRRAVAEVDAAATALADRPDDPHAARAYTAALEAADQVGAWDVDARISRMMSGLGLSHLPSGRATADLSGGERARLALAWLLLSRPQVLLLDEPTNHLDDAATEHLRGTLSTWGGPVLMASHDRAFLDEAATSLIDLDPHPAPRNLHDDSSPDDPATGWGITRFSGAYSDYLTARADMADRWERQYQEEQAELKRLSASMGSGYTVGHPGREPRTEARKARKFYADRNAKVVARRVNDARARYEILEERQITAPPKALTFRGLTAAGMTVPEGGEESLPILVAENVTLAGRLAPASLTLNSADKLLVTGPNGSGKSTLLHLLLRDLAPTGGDLARLPGVRIGLLAQDSELPDPRGRGDGRSARQAYADIVGSELAESVPLSTFGLLAARDEKRAVGVLSVGQRRRLALATLLADPPEVLLLDEPTNHLSLTLVTELEAAVVEYPGAVVIASHDRWLRRRWEGLHLELRPAGAPEGASAGR